MVISFFLPKFKMTREIKPKIHRQIGKYTYHCGVKQQIFGYTEAELEGILFRRNKHNAGGIRCKEDL